jgi:D-proline reductase (dithiol) PrdB
MEKVMNLSRIKNRTLAKVITSMPSLSSHFVNSYDPVESKDIPWTPVCKALSEAKIAIVTTSGVHHTDQQPFNMDDPDGDPSFREIDIRRPLKDLMITHDYYDHRDADRDINIVFPVERLREFEAQGVIGELASRHYGFMGHITGKHIQTLISESAVKVAISLLEDGVDAVLLTPG